MAGGFILFRVFAKSVNGFTIELTEADNGGVK